jgi:nicotinamidase-related amidase
MQAAIINHLPNYNEIIGKVAQAIAAARSKNIPVIYAVVNFRPGMPEVSMNNKVFAASKARTANANVNMDEMMKIDSMVAPLPGDIVVHKRRVSAFTGTDLEVVLRAQGIQHLILTGVATSGVVLSTLCEAADKDYQVTVLSDCCTDRDPEVHHVLVSKAFLFQGFVHTLEEWSNE